MSPLQGGPDHRDVSSSEGSVDRQTATPPSGYSMKQDQPFNQEGEGTMEEPDVDRGKNVINQECLFAFAKSLSTSETKNIFKKTLPLGPKGSKKHTKNKETKILKML